jgi:hypothetical protein
MLMSKIQPAGGAHGVRPSPDDSPGQQPLLEEQLATIIKSARSVAVVAEELLRELSQQGALGTSTPHAISMAPRLLAATEQQLASVSAMLRKG